MSVNELAAVDGRLTAEQTTQASHAAEPVKSVKKTAPAQDTRDIEKDKVDISPEAKAVEIKDGLSRLAEGWSPDSAAYEYDLSDDHDLIFRVVRKDDRAEVLRQYPSDETLAFKKQFRKLLKNMGVE